MSRWYLDSSAAVKLLVTEAESDALVRTLDRDEPSLVACWLLETELRRVVPQVPTLTQERVSTLLDRISFYDLSADDFRRAGLLPGEHLRSLDALHLAIAVRIGVDAILTYDTRMAQAARHLGIWVLGPTG